ncbi:hypothetical protein V2G26_005438 [Clonostachys chloroleuca]
MRFSTVLIATAATLAVANTEESAPSLALRDAEELEERDDPDQSVDERYLGDLETRGLQERLSPRARPPACYKCGSSTHFAKDCPYGARKGKRDISDFDLEVRRI